MSNNSNNRVLIALVPLCLLAVVVFSAGLVGCKKKEAPNTSPAAQQQVTVYFSKSRGTETVTEGVVRTLPQADPQTAGASELSYAIEQLLKGPSNDESVQGFYSEIPKGTRLLGVSEANGKLTVNLSQQFASGGGSNSMKQRMAELQQTVRSAAKDQPVFVTINGQKLETMGGEGIEVQQPITNNPG